MTGLVARDSGRQTTATYGSEPSPAVLTMF
jgi:hypothetical protein